MQGGPDLIHLRHMETEKDTYKSLPLAPSILGLLLHYMRDGNQYGVTHYTRGYISVMTCPSTHWRTL